MVAEIGTMIEEELDDNFNHGRNEWDRCRNGATRARYDQLDRRVASPARQMAAVGKACSNSGDGGILESFRLFNERSCCFSGEQLPCRCAVVETALEPRPRSCHRSGELQLSPASWQPSIEGRSNSLRTSCPFHAVILGEEIAQFTKEIKIIRQHTCR